MNFKEFSEKIAVLSNAEVDQDLLDLMSKFQPTTYEDFQQAQDWVYKLQMLRNSKNPSRVPEQVKPSSVGATTFTTELKGHYKFSPKKK